MTERYNHNLDYSIIIPSKNAGNLKVCLGSLFFRQPYCAEKIVVYDNDPTGGVENLCKILEVGRVKGTDRPFVFSQAINSCIEFCPKQDVILLNDDATLETKDGFDALHLMSVEHGIMSAAIRGMCGNPEQLYKETGAVIRDIPSTTTVFICVHISRKVLDRVGPLDERLIHYGYDDDLYCLQTRAAGFKIGVYDGCVVKHGELPSTYRTPGNMPDLSLNKRIFERIVHEKGLTHHWPHGFEFPFNQVNVEGAD